MVEQTARRRRGRSLAEAIPFSILLFSAVLLVGAVLPADALAGSSSVRYSYEQVEVAGRSQWVLVPRPEKKLQGKVTTDTIRTAFQLLRNEKGTSYGDTTIEVDGGSVDGAKVKVHIDPDYSKYKLIIMAETVYTLTELGVDEIRFPGYAEGNVRRTDIPFTAYTVTLPLWRALPPETLTDARVRMPDGELVGLEEIERRWEQGDGALRKALFSYLDADQSYTVVSVVQRLPKLDVSYAKEVVPLLEHENLGVRKAALGVLKNKRNRQDVLEAVVTLMQNEASDALARSAAEFLGKADSEKYSVYRQFFYLQRGNKKERSRAAKKLGSIEGDARVVEKLAGALRTEKHAQVASQAAKSLLKLDAHGKLAEALQDGKVPGSVRMEIARGLTEEPADGAKVDGYRYLGANAEGRDARVAVRALGEIETTEAREAVESFLTDDDRKVRLAAAETVRKIGSTKSLGAIAEAVRSGKNAKVIEDAGFAILKSKRVSTVLRFTRSSDATVQRMAYRALGPKAKAGAGGSQVLETLRKGAQHSDPKVRGAAARGLGALANKQALSVLKKLADDSDAEVRRGVAYALGNYGNGEMAEKLSSYLEDDSPEVVAAALSSLVDRKEARDWEKIKKLARSEHAIVRKHAVIAMASLVSKDDDEASREVISLLSGTITSDKDDAVLRTAVTQLGKFKRERAVNSIAIKMNAKEKSMQLTAIRALGSTGHKSAIDLLADKLDSSDSEIRRATVQALGDLGMPRVKVPLKQRLGKEKDPGIKKLIRKTLNEI